MECNRHSYLLQKKKRRKVTTFRKLQNPSSKSREVSSPKGRLGAEIRARPAWLKCHCRKPTSGRKRNLIGFVICEGKFNTKAAAFAGLRFQFDAATGSFQGLF